ncbi:unnamed protein product [Closterium sp. NIES-54]
MLGNACEACGLEHVDDNTLQSHVSNNIKCRRKIQHSRAQRLVEAHRDALRVQTAMEALRRRAEKWTLLQLSINQTIP